MILIFFPIYKPSGSYSDFIIASKGDKAKKILLGIEELTFNDKSKDSL
tara:strand:- start:1033 stop:1176 length:144 start_codon:yes stop_codon:yes gene_type:complete